MELLLLGITYFLDVSRYYLVNILLFGSGIKRSWVYVFNGVACVVIAGVLRLSPTISYIMTYVAVMLTSMFLLEGNLKKRVFLSISLFTIFSCIDGILEMGIEVIYSLNAFSTAEKGIIEEIITIVLLILVLLLRKNNNLDIAGQWDRIKKSFSAIIIGVGSFLGFGLYVANRYTNYVVDEELRMKLNISSLLALISLLILLVFIFYIQRINEKMESVIEIERELKVMQTKYYCALLEKEENTRRYRHDMINHFMCLSEYAQEEDAYKTLEYIQTLQSGFLYTEKKEYDTGNPILDLLLSSYLRDIKGMNILVEGKCKHRIDISDVDMCTIFSNLIKNAIEEIERCETDNRYICINIKQGIKYTEIQIKNSSMLMQRDIKNFEVTSKADKKNHGIGLRNVKNAVEKNRGKLVIENLEGEFIVTVRLNCIIEKNNNSRS